MIHRNICPICGSENPEGSEFCQVCKANLQALPDSVFPIDNEVPEPEEQKAAAAEPEREEELDLDRPVPVWLKTKLTPSEKKMDFDTFADMLFGGQDSSRSASPQKALKQQKQRKSKPVYQPPLQNLIDPPLVESDEDNAKSLAEDIPGLADFLLQRPARKWEDREPRQKTKKTSVSLLTDFSKERPAKKWDDQTPAASSESTGKSSGLKASQLPLWWQQDSPLVELGPEEDTAKTTEPDDPMLELSASPTKVIDAVEIFGPEPRDEKQESAEGKETAVENDPFHPEDGSLISDLLNEMDSSSSSLTPSEQQENRNGTVFFSGNHPADAAVSAAETEIPEIPVADEENTASAELLDRILRNIGYSVEGEAQPAESSEEEKKEPQTPERTEQEASENTENTGQTEDKEEVKEDAEAKKEIKKKDKKVQNILKPLREKFVPQVIDNPLILVDEEETGGEDPDPYGLLEEKILEKEDTPDDNDIPWDLFGTADMALPQSPEDPEYRTFSRSTLPEDPGSTSYQQRMISSILTKIIQAENFVQPEKVKNDREINIWARLFLAVLAICGVIVILTTNLTDNLSVPAVPTAPESADFYQYAESGSGQALVVVDYTPAYSSIMSNAADHLLDTLQMNADKVFMAAVNPAAMPEAHRLLKEYEGKVEFSGWWPTGVVSIRSRLMSGNIPDQVWLLTSESSSVRYWSEQLSASPDTYHLHIMGPGQLEPLLKPYLQSGMVTSMLSHDEDLLNYGEETHTLGRTQFAVLYLAMLLPLAWLFGIIGNVMKTEPKYGRKSNVRNEESQQSAEAQAADPQTADEKDGENG